MSNLKLQNTNYAVLLKRLKDRKGKAVKVGNNTVATLRGDVIFIDYHGNGIARLDNEGITFSNAGWDTPTTRTRLNIIADHNNVPVSFTQSKHRQMLSARRRMWNGGEWHTLSDDFHSVTWESATDRLLSTNGVDFTL